jgi:hypothetical protein
MGIEIIHHPPDPVRRGEVHVDQQLHLPGKILLGPLRRDIHLAPAPQRLHEQKQVGRAFALVLVVIAGRLTGAGRPLRRSSGQASLPQERAAPFAGQLHRAFVKADLGTPGIIGLGVQIQHVFPMPDIIGTYAGNAPRFTLPGLEVVFLSTRRTVSGEIASTCRSSIRRSASTCRVHRRRPAGGVL